MHLVIIGQVYLTSGDRHEDFVASTGRGFGCGELCRWESSQLVFKGTGGWVARTEGVGRTGKHVECGEMKVVSAAAYSVLLVAVSGGSATAASPTTYTKEGDWAHNELRSPGRGGEAARSRSAASGGVPPTARAEPAKGAAR